MNKTALYALIIALLVPLLGYFIMKTVGSDAVVMPRHYIYDSVSTKTVNGKLVEDTVWHRVPDFHLQNQLGQHVSLKDLEGKVLIADFFFTHCPTICPTMTMNMKRLQEGITNGQRAGNLQPDFLQFLSFSVDPERDSVTALKKWNDRFQIDPDNWWLLTGDKKQIYDFSINDLKLGLIDGKGIDTSFFHTDLMVLIDKNRHIRGYYHGLDTMDISRLSKDIVLLQLEKDPKRSKPFGGNLELLSVVFLLTFVGLGLLIYFLKREKKKYNVDDHQK